MGTLLTNESEILSRASKSHLRTPLLYPPLTVGEDFSFVSKVIIKQVSHLLPCRREDFFTLLNTKLLMRTLLTNESEILSRTSKSHLRTPLLYPPLTVGEDFSFVSKVIIKQVSHLFPCRRGGFSFIKLFRVWSVYLVKNLYICKLCKTYKEYGEK